MTTDSSVGWDDAADAFLKARSGTGAELVRSWVREHLRLAQSVVDIGCGFGEPVTRVLVDEGLDVFAIDASPRLIDEFRRRFPDVPCVCEPAQRSTFFDRSFDAAIAVGLVFLLSAEDQALLIRNVASALSPVGHFLFSAPHQPAEWEDMLTGRTSVSLGRDAYIRLLDDAGLSLAGTLTDEGGNHYFDAMKQPL